MVCKIILFSPEFSSRYVLGNRTGLFADDEIGREMAIGNVFGATALSSYGGFWISFAIILTPGGFHIVETLEEESLAAFHNSFGFFLMVRGWLACLLAC